MFVEYEAMKAVIIYFTMGGRTKKNAIAIGDVLSNYEVDYFPMELKGNLNWCGGRDLNARTPTR